MHHFDKAAFWDGFPDAPVTAQEVIETEDVLAVRHVTIGTQQKTLFGVAASSLSGGLLLV